MTDDQLGLMTEEAVKTVFKERDVQAQAIFIDKVADNHPDIINKCGSSRVQTSTLGSAFVQSSSFSWLSLWRRLMFLKLNNNEKLDDHFLNSIL